MSGASRRLTRRKIVQSTNPDQFTLGITQPTRSNTGCPSDTVLTIHQGDYTVDTAGAIVEGLRITGRLYIRANNVTVKNCVVQGGPDTGSTRFMVNISLNTTNTLLERVSIIPTNPSVYAYGIVGTSFIARRCYIGGAALPEEPNYLKDGPVDALNFELQNCVAEGCLLETTQYPSDPAQGGGPSHSDCIQISGGHDYKIIGCSMNAQSQGIVLTPYRSLMASVEIKQNWFFGAFTQFSSWPRWNEGGPGIPGLTIVGNRFLARGPGANDVHYNILMTPESSLGALVEGNVLLDGNTPANITIAANNQGTMPASVSFPVANAGPDQVVASGRRVVLMVRGQTDTGIPARWRWERADNGSPIPLIRSGYADYYTAPTVQAAQKIVWRLITINTNGTESNPDTCEVTHAPTTV